MADYGDHGLERLFGACTLAYVTIDLEQHPKIIELGCGAAQLSRQLLARYPACEVAGLDVDEGGFKSEVQPVDYAVVAAP